MAITVNSTFERVGLIWNLEENRWDQLYVLTDGVTPESASIYFPIGAGSDAATLLAVLQEIYASSAGFVDAGGNPSYSRIQAPPNVNEIADLESNGYANPLIAGWGRSRSKPSSSSWNLSKRSHGCKG